MSGLYVKALTSGGLLVFNAGEQIKVFTKS